MLSKDLLKRSPKYKLVNKLMLIFVPGNFIKIEK